MAKIIIEGPDGAGKSYAIEHIRSAINIPLYPIQGPPKSPSDAVNMVTTALDAEGYIFDRFPLISEMIYGPIIRNTHIFDPSWLKRLNPEEDFIVYVRPSRDVILSHQLESKPHKPLEHVRKVQEKHNKIIDAYDELMNRVPHIRFDRDGVSMHNLCAMLTALWERVIPGYKDTIK